MEEVSRFEFEKPKKNICKFQFQIFRFQGGGEGNITKYILGKVIKRTFSLLKFN